MTRTFLTRTGITAALAGLSLMALVGLVPSDAPEASAQGVPPAVPTLFYGTAAGAAIGANVVAVVETGGQGINCGIGKVLNSGGPVYAVQVVTDAQKAGCGAPGRQVRMYVSAGPDDHTGAGKLSNAKAWPGSPANPDYDEPHNLTLGAELDEVRYMQLATSEGFAQ